MGLPSLYVDFMNADAMGQVRMNCTGTLEDLERLDLVPQNGMRIVVHDEELEAEGELRFSDAEQIWVTRIDWNALRPVTPALASQPLLTDHPVAVTTRLSR